MSDSKIIPFGFKDINADLSKLFLVLLAFVSVK